MSTAVARLQRCFWLSFSDTVSNGVGQLLDNPQSARLLWASMKNRAVIFLILIVAVVSALPSQARTDDPEREKRIAWWREARFGMFIHWGLYAVPAGEWKGQPVR